MSSLKTLGSPNVSCVENASSRPTLLVPCFAPLTFYVPFSLHRLPLFRPIYFPIFCVASVIFIVSSRQLGAFRSQSRPTGPLEDMGPGSEFASSDHTTFFSNTSFACLLVQALPITLVYPFRRVILWFLIAWPWVEFMKNGFGRFTALVLAMITMRLVVSLAAPLLGILVKWVVIGRYKAGKYPLWGGYYLRWWFVEQVVNILGRGRYTHCSTS